MLATSLLQGLKDHGAREIFGIPGDFVLPFFKVIEDSGILPHYTLSHEPGVGFAADAAARYHAGLGVAVVTYGAGAFNLVNAIAGAYAERSPVVVIAGAPGAGERSSGFGVHHQARSIDTQCGCRAGGNRARVAQRPRAFAAGLYRAAARHDGGADRGRPGAATALG
jgi:indolepyruvate decarboxylase